MGGLAYASINHSKPTRKVKDLAQELKLKRPSIAESYWHIMTGLYVREDHEVVADM
jgi:Mn-dependent DtxR family transcriptional regulator